jgi:hypothetical protein
VLVPLRAPAGAEGEPCVEFGAEQGGRNGDQGVRDNPRHERGHQRHRSTGGEPDTTAEQNELDKGTEYAPAHRASL